jgi:hypothetical protein
MTMTGMTDGIAPVDRVIGHCDGWPELPDPRFLPFLRHWAERRRGLMMAKQDIDPIALKSCLPNVWLHRYRPEDDDFVCVLAGEQVNAAWGGSIANRSLREIMRPEQYGLTLARYRQVLRLPAIQMVRRTIVPSAAVAKDTDRLILPVSDGDGQPVGIFGMTLYHFDPLAGRDLPVGQDGEAVMYLCAGLPADAP